MSNSILEIEWKGGENTSNIVNGNILEMFVNYE